MHPREKLWAAAAHRFPPWAYHRRTCVLRAIGHSNESVIAHFVRVFEQLFAAPQPVENARNQCLRAALLSRSRTLESMLSDTPYEKE